MVVIKTKQITHCYNIMLPPYWKEWVNRSIEEGGFKVDYQDDYSFVRDKTSGLKERIIEHPALSNRNHKEYRFCHPRQPRARISNATFRELSSTLEDWEPDHINSIYSWIKVYPHEISSDEVLEKCLIN